MLQRPLSRIHPAALHLIAFGAVALVACGDDGGDTTTASSAGPGATSGGAGGGGSDGGGGDTAGATTTGTTAGSGGAGQGGSTTATGGGGAGGGAGGAGGGPGGGGGGAGGGSPCEDGQALCDGACVDGALSCGVAVPAACEDEATCGGVATCVDARCVCTDGHRACAMGCCPVTLDEATIADVIAEDARLAFGPDGTAYLALAVEEEGSYERDLHLYARAPGGALERADLTILDLSNDDRAFDLVVRPDGVVFVAHALGSNPGAVRLVRWSPGEEPEDEPIGSTYQYDPGVSIDVDGEATVWVSFASPQNTGDVYGFALESDETRRTIVRDASGSIAQTVVRARSTGEVYAFWGHRYTGNFVSGTVPFTDSPALAPTCPVDDARFGPDDVLWSVYNSYSSIRTHVCRDGVSTELRNAAIEGGFPTSVNGARIAVDDEGVAHVAVYQHVDYEATWLSTVDGQAWSRVELPVDFGNPTGTITPGRATTAVATRPDGRASIAVVPMEPGMGLLRLFDVL